MSKGNSKIPLWTTVCRSWAAVRTSECQEDDSKFESIVSGGTHDGERLTSSSHRQAFIDHMTLVERSESCSKQPDTALEISPSVEARKGYDD